ncbi:MAG: glycosyltransferase family 2 protein [Candidatus Cryptobacteroides sp.]
MKIVRISTLERVSSAKLESIVSENQSQDYILWQDENLCVEIDEADIQRLVSVAEDCAADMVYADSRENADGKTYVHPRIDCQYGSLRDDFDFGPVVLYRSSAFAQAVRAAREDVPSGYEFAALYDLRLRMKGIVHLKEYLYTQSAKPVPAGGEAQFDYVKASNRAVQIEMERACTLHLKRIGAFVPAPPAPPAIDGDDYEVEASVIIPVLNREKTIADAVRSALGQDADFPYNVIVVDNHSTDATTRILRELAAVEKRLVVLTPSRSDLGIGGCWNLAVQSRHCGKYAVQLDSDDIYSGPDSLARMVSEFGRGECAMVIGSYTIVDFNLNPLPPGLIDHREWTDTNGHNNALRINGFGAPRAFRTDLLRQFLLPNVSYGEDYAAALRLSGLYRIGRIYDSLYFCRRWGGNSDSNLSIEKLNRNNSYKDSIRTIELKSRILRNGK